MLRVLLLYLKVAIFHPEQAQEHAPRTTFVLKSCDFKPELLRTRAESSPRPRDCERDNFQRPLREQKNRTAPQRERFDTHDLRRESRGRRKKKTQKHLEFLHLDHPDLRRGSRGHIKKHNKNLEFLHLDHAEKTRKKNPRIFAPRPRRSPQRVARAPQKKKTQKKSARVFAPRPRQSPQRIARAPQKNAKKNEFLHLDHADLRRGSRGHIKKRKNFEFLHLDHADLRRGSHSRSSATSPPPRLKRDS